MLGKKCVCAELKAVSKFELQEFPDSTFMMKKTLQLLSEHFIARHSLSYAPDASVRTKNPEMHENKCNFVGNAVQLRSKISSISTKAVLITTHGEYFKTPLNLV